MRSRVHRALQKDSVLGSHWEGMSESDKNEFFKTQHNKMGKSLSAAIYESVRKTFRTSESSAFVAEGTWLSEAELACAIKDENELKHTKANARRFFDPVRGTILFEHLTYKTTKKEEEEHDTLQGHSLSQERKRKAEAPTRTSKKAKAEASASAAASAIPEKAMNSKQVNTLEKAKAKLAKKLEAADTTCTQADNLKGYIPNYAIADCKVSLAGVGDSLAQVDLALSSGMARFNQLQKGLSQH